ncbi:MAG TPA: hypothetical protein PLU30_14445 [Verrucomicrobiae bacterium]|nr:hypothetical protein [Verrucomicrobiae bacterium]
MREGYRNGHRRSSGNADGDAVVIKGGGKASQFTYAAGWNRGGVIDGARPKGRCSVAGFSGHWGFRMFD